MADTNRQSRTNRYLILLLILWTLLIGGSLLWNLYAKRMHLEEAARLQARALSDKDILYRRWNNRHGGVYVAVTPEAQPNPFMADYPWRDITTAGGKQLTLINPPYMSRQVSELQQKELGFSSRITSLKPINPANRPDAWERAALTRFEDGSGEIVEFLDDRGTMTLRFMRPLFVEEGCLDCHNSQGYAIGDVRGGLSVSIPMGPIYASAIPTYTVLSLSHLVLWIFGVIGSCRAFANFNRANTKRRTAEGALREAKVAAEEASRAKSEFLATMSHEVRTPLNAISGLTDLTLETDLTKEQRDFLGMVKTSADSLLRIINDILDFSKVEAGMLEFEEIDFSPRDMVEKTVAALAVRAHKKDLELVCRISPEVPSRLAGDPMRLRQVLMNLLDNAIKFTERGEVELTLDIEPTAVPAPSICHLRFAVRDSGIGISPENLLRLFRSFSQAETSTARRFGGTGLGLVISKKLVEQMGGRPRVESRPGAGSTFSFTVPLPIPPPFETADTDQIAELAGCPLLLIDDNASSRKALERMLSELGAKVTSAATAAKGLQLVNEHAEAGSPFAALVLDANMPETDGFALVEDLAEHPELKARTLMMLSAVNLTEDAARCRRLKIYHYLSKPISGTALRKALLATIKGQPAEPAPTLDLDRAQGAQRAPGYPSNPLWGYQPVHILLAEDDDNNRKLALALLGKKGWLVTAVRDGLEAVAAVETRKFDLVLMDVQMPNLDGLEATRRIRRLPQPAASVPIVGLTAHAMKRDREKCLEAGMDDYTPKPIKSKELYATIQRLLPEPAEKLSGDNAAPAVDLSELLNEFAETPEIIQELKGEFLTNYPRYLQNLRAAIGARDSGRTERAAHTLKSLLGIFRAEPAYRLAEQLENQGARENLQGTPDLLKSLEEELVRVKDALDRF